MVTRLKGKIFFHFYLQFDVPFVNVLLPIQQNIMPVTLRSMAKLMAVMQQ